MRLTSNYTRIAAFDEESTPEQEEEFRSRDWTEVTRPSPDASNFGWKFEGSYSVSGELPTSWHTSGGGYDSGPRWIAQKETSENPVHSKIQYTIWVQRKLNEDWRGDFYEYFFNSFYKIISSKKTNKKPVEVHTLASGDTLAEVKIDCEEHYKENFGVHP